MVKNRSIKIEASTKINKTTNKDKALTLNNEKVME
jgi:hypothetical protein